MRAELRIIALCAAGLIAWAYVATADVLYIKSRGEGVATSTPAQIIPLNQRRKYLFVQNKSTTRKSIYLEFETASGGTTGYEIPAGGNYESDLIPIGPVFVKTETGTAPYFYLENQ